MARAGEDDAVVAPQHLHREVEAREPFLDGERPRRVHPRAERREDADAPVADLVGEALDHDRAVVGDRAGGLGLLVEVGAEVLARALVEPVAAQRRLGFVGRVAELADERAERAAELERPAGLSPLQNGILAGSPGAGVTTTRSSVISSMRHVGRAEHEALADPALVDHLLVELADTARRRGGTRRRGHGRGSCRRS